MTIKPMTTEVSRSGQPVKRATQEAMREHAAKNGWLAMSDSDEMTVFVTPCGEVRPVYYADGFAFLHRLSSN